MILFLDFTKVHLNFVNLSQPLPVQNRVLQKPCMNSKRNSPDLLSMKGFLWGEKNESEGEREQEQPSLLESDGQRADTCDPGLT